MTQPSPTPSHSTLPSFFWVKPHSSFSYPTYDRLTPLPPWSFNSRCYPGNWDGEPETEGCCCSPAFCSSPGLEFLFGEVLIVAEWPQRNVIWVWTGFATSLFKAFMVRFNTDIQINYLKSSKEAHQIFLALNRFISICTYLCYLNSIACS